MISAGDIASVIGGKLIQEHSSAGISDIILDTRKPFVGKSAVFFAISGATHDGHDHVQSAWEKGVRTFVVEKEISLPESTIVQVEDSLKALQALGGHRRSQFDYPVIGITGSNGKTVVKEWLNQLLSADYQIVRSPRSYNSQVGVPLSLWNMEAHHSLGIFEAGISQPGEMAAHAKMVNPSIGVLTNVRTAHAENFESRKQHIEEKLLLMAQSSYVILPDDPEILEAARKSCSGKILVWGKGDSADLKINEVRYHKGNAFFNLSIENQEVSFTIPFSDEASVSNVVTCAAVLHTLGLSLEEIEQRLGNLHGVGMRLESVAGANNTHIINDAYSMDVDSLRIACEFTDRLARFENRIAILSDFPEGQNDDDQYGKAAQALTSAGFKKIYAIGSDKWKQFGADSFYASVDSFLASSDFDGLSNADILIKGARSQRFERIVDALRAKVHRTRLEINLAAMERNLSAYRAICPTDTRIMCMVKAAAYGNGSSEVAQLLEFNKVDYLGVAYVDEGVTLRQSGCSLPIMVMNPNLDNVARLEQYNLEPEVYSLNALRKLDGYSGVKIHLKVDTGMHRLGVEIEELDEVLELLSKPNSPQVASVFSHFAASEDEAFDDFSREQIELFKTFSQRLVETLNYSIIKHMANTAGIKRFPEASFDMVRLGVGLYGVKTHQDSDLQLDVVTELKSTITQIKELKAGDSVGYGRSFVATAPTTSATIPIGYADGLFRRLSDGVGQFIINGQPAPILGKVCMDMVMVDVTNIDCKEGDEVEIFGQQQAVEDLAAAAGTIAYEVIASIPERVTRVFLQE
jgi:alanine racemase